MNGIHRPFRENVQVLIGDYRRYFDDSIYIWFKSIGLGRYSQDRAAKKKTIGEYVAVIV